MLSGRFCHQCTLRIFRNGLRWNARPLTPRRYRFLPKFSSRPLSSPFSHPSSSPLLPFLHSPIWSSCQSRAGVLVYVIISSLCITQGWAKAPRCAASHLKKRGHWEAPPGQCLTGVPSVEQPQFRLEISRGSFCQRAIPPAAPVWISHPALPPLPRGTTPFPSCCGQPYTRFLPLGRNHPCRFFGADHPAGRILALCYFLPVFLRRRLWVFHSILELGISLFIGCVFFF